MKRENPTKEPVWLSLPYRFFQKIHWAALQFGIKARQNAYCPHNERIFVKTSPERHA